MILRISIFFAFLLTTSAVVGQSEYPKEIRGYKVERAIVEVKKPDSRKGKWDPEPAEDDLIKLGDPRLVTASPLGIRLEVPVLISPVKQKGKVDFLMFEEIVINGTPVRIEEYRHKFKLPEKEPQVLKNPLRFYIYLPNVLLAALGEWNESKEEWLLTGRVYVFGEFKKLLFNFKRCIPVELNLTIRNPLRK